MGVSLFYTILSSQHMQKELQKELNIPKSKAEKELEEMEKQCDVEEKKYNELKKRTQEQTPGYLHLSGAFNEK